MTAEQMSLFDTVTDSDISSGRTSRERSSQTRERTSGRSSKKSSGSKIPKFQFLDLRTENGRPQDVSWGTDIRWLGEFLTHNIGVSPSAEKESILYVTSTGTQLPESCLTVINISEAPIHPEKVHLIDILERNPDPKYTLSARACQGILDRINRRGKAVPEILLTALKQTIARELSASNDGQDVIHTVSTSTKGPGAVAYPVRGCSWDGGQTSPTLTKNNAGGNQRMPDIDNCNLVICERAFQYTVRRLTPLECERLQGYPDYYTDIGEYIAGRPDLAVCTI